MAPSWNLPLQGVTIAYCIVYNFIMVETTQESVALDSANNERSTHNHNVFRTLVDFCNNLPFSGKLIITPVTETAFRERNPYYKTIKTIEAGGVLGLMILAHSSQAQMGIANLTRNAELLSKTHSPEALLACGIDVAYTAANCAATYAQLYLSGRLVDHFVKTKSKAVPMLSAWGVDGDDVNYDQMAEKLMTAIVNNDQDDIDTFFMVLPQKTKQKTMESIKMITEVVDETYSYDEVENKIRELEKDIDNKSRFRYVFNLIVNAHKSNMPGSRYSFKETMKMFVVTLGGQMGFLGLG